MLDINRLVSKFRDIEISFLAADWLIKKNSSAPVQPPKCPLETCPIPAHHLNDAA